MSNLSAALLLLFYRTDAAGIYRAQHVARTRSAAPRHYFWLGMPLRRVGTCHRMSLLRTMVWAAFLPLLFGCTACISASAAPAGCACHNAAATGAVTPLL
jgi:hypothetical protein